MGRMLIKNARAVVTLNEQHPVSEHIDILIHDNIIVDIGKNLEVDPDVVVFDASNHVVYPGFVNTHHHFYQTLFRGVPKVQSVKLFDWLVYLYPRWAKITYEDVFAAARLAMAELLLSGCTTTSDHHYLFPENAPNELLDAEFEAAAEMGIRFLGTRGSMSRGKSKGGLPPDEVVQTEDEILKDSLRVIEKWHDPSEYSMSRVALAPCSPFSVTDDLMRESAKLARQMGVRLHTHLAETKDEEAYCLEVYGKRPLAYMQDLDWVGEDVWFAHGIYFNDEELKILAETKTGVAHCPVSNLRLGSGIAQVPKMLSMGIPVGLAVDGAASNDSSNMLREAQQAFLIHRIKDGVDSTNVVDTIRVASEGGAKVLGWSKVGRIQPKYAADLVVWDLDDIGMTGFWDPVAAPIMGVPLKRPALVMVNGSVLVRDGHLIGIDERKIIEDATKAINRLMEG